MVNGTKEFYFERIEVMFECDMTKKMSNAALYMNFDFFLRWLVNYTREMFVSDVLVQKVVAVATKKPNCADSVAGAFLIPINLQPT